MGGEFGQLLFPVMPTDSTGDTETELVTGRIGRHLADITRDDLHGIAAIAHQEGVTACGLRGRTVDDGNEVTCDDEAVLAFLLGVLCDLALFDDIHCYYRVS